MIQLVLVEGDGTLHPATGTAYPHPHQDQDKEEDYGAGVLP
jgi:hypothetical protein